MLSAETKRKRIQAATVRAVALRAKADQLEKQAADLRGQAERADTDAKWYASAPTLDEIGDAVVDNP